MQRHPVEPVQVQRMASQFATQRVHPDTASSPWHGEFTRSELRPAPPNDNHILLMIFNLFFLPQFFVSNFGNFGKRKLKFYSMAHFAIQLDERIERGCRGDNGRVRLVRNRLLPIVQPQTFTLKHSGHPRTAPRITVDELANRCLLAQPELLVQKRFKSSTFRRATLE